MIRRMLFGNTLFLCGIALNACGGSQEPNEHPCILQTSGVVQEIYNPPAGTLQVGTNSPINQALTTGTCQ